MRLKLEPIVFLGNVAIRLTLSNNARVEIVFRVCVAALERFLRLSLTDVSSIKLAKEMA